MMNKQELQQYRDNLFSEYKKDELGFQRVKLELANKKKMIDLLDEQITTFDSEESSVSTLLDIAKHGVK